MTISRVPRAWSPERKSGEEEGFRHFLEACWSGDMVSINISQNITRNLRKKWYVERLCFLEKMHILNPKCNAADAYCCTHTCKTAYVRPPCTQRKHREIEGASFIFFLRFPQISFVSLPLLFLVDCLPFTTRYVYMYSFIPVCFTGMSLLSQRIQVAGVN